MLSKAERDAWREHIHRTHGLSESQSLMALKDLDTLWEALREAIGPEMWSDGPIKLSPYEKEKVPNLARCMEVLEEGG